MYAYFTENKTRWTQHDNDTRLDVRIGDIHNWMDTLSKTLHDTEEEIDKVRPRAMCAVKQSIYSLCYLYVFLLFFLQLSEHKERVEKALEAKTMPLEVALSCLSLREGRVAIDLVRDEVEAQLHKVQPAKVMLQ